MGIEEVARIVGRIAAGIEEECLRCMSDNRGIILNAVMEQLKSGVDGEDEFLRPTYDDDPFFEERGFWYHRSEDYKKWKATISPAVGNILGLPVRPYNVPNLWIDGTFYGDIRISRHGDTIVIDPGDGNGPAIISKYGDQILAMGTTAKGYFNETYMLPAIDKFFKDCGYR